MQRALSDALSAACVRYGAATALASADATLRYDELLEHAQAIATALRAAGVEADEPVHIHVSNQPLDLAALLGAWLAGAVAVPVHRTTPPAVAAAFHERTRARFLLDVEPRRDLQASLSSIADHAPERRALLHGAAFIIFTSGSTGVPKGVVVSHEAFHGKIEQIDSLLRFECTDRTLLVLNITFSFGLWVGLLTLLRGARLVMLPKFEARSFLDTLLAERITRVGMVPTMMRVLFADAAHGAAIDRVAEQRSLRQILIGGESLGLSLAESIRARFAHTDLIDIYGLTETATCDFFGFPADFVRYPGAIGRPSPNVTYRIADGYGRPVDAGAIGELQIRSPYLMRGYLDDPALTATAYTDGWFRTGDLGREIDGQVVELMGRQKEIISRAGNKVTPVEIESAVASHPDVAAAMAVGIADPLIGEQIHVLVVPNAGAALDLATLRAHLAPRLEKFKQPDAYYLAEALPQGRTGKADRASFKALVTSGQLERWA